MTTSSWTWNLLFSCDLIRISFVSHRRYSTNSATSRNWRRQRKLRNSTMGLHKNYLKVGNNASSQIFGIPRVPRGSTPLSMLISYGAKFNSSKLPVGCNKSPSRVASRVPWSVTLFLALCCLRLSRLPRHSQYKRHKGTPKVNWKQFHRREFSRICRGWQNPDKTTRRNLLWATKSQTYSSPPIILNFVGGMSKCFFYLLVALRQISFMRWEKASRVSLSC